VKLHAKDNNVPTIMTATWPRIVLTSAGVTKRYGKSYGGYDIGNYVENIVNYVQDMADQVEDVEMHYKKNVKQWEITWQLKSNFIGCFIFTNETHCFTCRFGFDIIAMDGY
jgi:hypothetical protein